MEWKLKTRSSWADMKAFYFFIFKAFGSGHVARTRPLDVGT